MNEKDEEKVKSAYVDDEPEQEGDAEEEEESAIVPPNGGWGWVVVFSAFYCNVVVDGIQLTFGMFLQSISSDFKASLSETALAGSLIFGIHLLMGPVCSGCSAVFGLRPVTITGCLICSFGVGISYFATTNYYLYFSYGVLGGRFGFGLARVSVSKRFMTSLGYSLYSLYVAQWCYSIGLGLVYMNTLIVTSLYFTTYMPLAIGIVVCGTGVGTIVFALLGYSLLKVTSWQNSFLLQSALAGSMVFAAATFKPLKPVKVKISVRSERETPEPAAHSARSTNATRMSIYLTDIRNDSDFNSRENIIKNLWEKVLEEEIVNEMSTEKKDVCGSCTCCGKCKSSRRKDREKVLLLMEVKNRRESFVSKAPPTAKSGSQDLESDGESRTASVSSEIRVYKRVYVDSKKPKLKTFTLLKQTMTRMLDYHLLQSCAFTLFTICGAVQISTMIIVYMYEEDRCRDLGFDEDQLIYFLVTLGASTTFWRLFFGILALYPKTNKLIAILCIIIGGICTLCSGLSENIYYQFCYCFFFGLTMASIAVFRVVLLVELVGWELVSNATGINLMFMGVFCIICPPVLGAVTDATKNYDVIFCTSGSLFLLSGLVQAGIPKIRERELKKQERRAAT